MNEGLVRDAYKSRPNLMPLPVTEAVATEGLSLPTGTAMEPELIAAVCELIRFAHGQAAEISARTPAMEP